ncbi:MAG: response regulator [Elusimicrobia bacterium]|nr:response regulator [Elusimicrobiota bacterium]
MAKILVIDDDAAIVDLLRLRLAESGHQVVAAMDAYSAAAAAAREKPDLITLDFQMPAGDGAKTLERLRGNVFTEKTPIIFVSGMAPHDLEAAIPKDPKVRVLPKPIDVAKLQSLIAELLGAPPPAAPPPAPAPAPKPPKTEDLSGGALGGDILDLDV